MLCGIKVKCASQQRPGCLQTGAVSSSRHQRSAKIVHMIKVLPDTKQDGIFQKFGAFCGHAALVGMLLCCDPAQARLEGVNKPELLPNGPFTPVIDVAGFLTEGQESRIKSRLNALEQDTGIKLRVLAQNYPDTPGLAIKDYWGVDDDTIVFVADPNTGNILNFNVGQNVDFRVPRSFWSKLAGQYGNKFYWTDNGEDVAIVNAVAAIDNCLREPMGRLQCSTIRGELE